MFVGLTLALTAIRKAIGGGGVTSAPAILIETGFGLLLESGSYLLLE